jgi:hypothetical protein
MQPYFPLRNGWMHRRRFCRRRRCELLHIPVERGYIASELRTLGRVAAVRESTLYFRRSGRVRQLLVEPGDAISENQILARLETGDLEHRLKLAQVDLERVEMEYQGQKACWDWRSALMS